MSNEESVKATRAAVQIGSSGADGFVLLDIIRSTERLRFLWFKALKSRLCEGNTPQI